MDLKPPAPFVQGSLTSLEAALSMEPHLHPLEQRIMVLFDYKKQYPPGWTDAELIERLGTQSARPRRIRLVQLGKLKDSGLTRKTPSGRRAAVWVIA